MNDFAFTRQTNSFKTIYFKFPDIGEVFSVASITSKEWEPLGIMDGATTFYQMNMVDSPGVYAMRVPINPDAKVIFGKPGFVAKHVVDGNSQPHGGMVPINSFTWVKIN